MRIFISGLFVFLALPGAAFAACSSPAGVSGRIEYISSATEQVHWYCNGTDWVPLAIEPVTGAPAPTANAIPQNLDDLLDVNAPTPADTECLKYDNGAGEWINGACGGTPAGADREIQFNNGGAFGANAGLVFSSTGDLMVSGTYTGTASVPAYNAGTRMFFDTQKGAFRMGRVTGAKWNNASIGNYSVATGFDTTASGGGSTAMGWSTTASGGNSTAMGINTTASGNDSTATGTSTIASAPSSTAMGNSTIAAGDSSLAAGTEINVTATGDASFGFGLTTTSPGTDPQVSGAQSFGIFMGNHSGVNFAAANTMLLAGGKLIIDPTVPATYLTANAALDVNGGVKIANDAGACVAAKNGTIRYVSGASPPWEFCDGSAWSPFKQPRCQDDGTGECYLQATRSNDDPDFIATNIADGVNILGVTGTLTGGGGSCDTTPTEYTTPGSFVYTVPSGCSTVQIQAYGAGGGGANNTMGAGGGGGSVGERSGGALLVAAGGGGGGGGNNSRGGGGGGYASATVAVAANEDLVLYVGGGGASGGGNGGAYNGGSGGPSGGTSGGNSTYGGGGGGWNESGGSSTYGGGGGGDDGRDGGGSTYGGGGGGGNGGAGGNSVNGNDGLNGTGSDAGPGGGGGGFGDTVINGSNGSGTTGGAAANSGPGSGGGSNTAGGNGKIVITPVAGGAFFAATMSVGEDHICALKADGTAWCWGAGTNGKVGNGGTADQGPPAAVDLTGVTGTAWTKISAGADHSCGIRNNGTAWCWGEGSFGQRGDSSTVATQSTPVLVGTTGVSGSNWTEIDAGGDHTCALRDDNTAWCWGRDTYGQLGDDATLSDKSAPVAVSTAGVSGTGWTGISTGSNHSCGLRDNGTAWCWGRDNIEQLGDGAGATNQGTPAAVSLTGVTGTSWIAAPHGGANYTCGIRDNGTGWCWGENGTSRLGDGTSTDRNVPQAVNTENVTGTGWTVINPQVDSASDAHTCGIRDDGTGYCWGVNNDGEIGIGVASGWQGKPQALVVTDLPGTAWLDIGAAIGSSCGLRDNNVIYCWGAGSWRFNGDLYFGRPYAGVNQ